MTIIKVDNNKKKLTVKFTKMTNWLIAYFD